MAGEINFFAETTFRNEKKKFGIKTDDRRRHVYIIGKTGSGKTAMMENMAIQDIQEGRGVGFVDPHGEAAERLLDFVPPSRINDVVYFNPADLDYPIAFNVMDKVSSEHRHLVASGLMGVFKKIWPDVWSARMEYILNNAILSLLEYPNSTLLGVNRMLADVEFRAKVVDKVSDPVIKAFWLKEFAKYAQKYETEATAAIQNKIGQFISNPLVRNIIGQVKSKIDMRKIMDEKKILIANISKGRIGEDNSRLLGALVITKLQLAAMSRVDIPEEKREDFFLYVDEFQNFATDAFCTILSEARKYRLALILGNQYIGQLEEMTASGKSTRVRDAVFGNVGTIVTFRMGAEDAEFLEKEFLPEFMAADLVGLAKYNIYLKLMVNGLSSRPFSAQTLPPFESPAERSREKIISVSREKYAAPREIIKEKIQKWSTGGEESSAAPTARPASPANGPVLYDAQCANCKKWTKVIFPPDGKRPVYCKPCLKKIEDARKTPAPSVSLNKIEQAKPTSFQKQPIRKPVNVEELKSVLGEALNKIKQDGNPKGF
ncbi:MAG: type IV secretion system DNA-binding domain-containing protein [Patescibacteria group bacterium]